MQRDFVATLYKERRWHNFRTIRSVGYLEEDKPKSEIELDGKCLAAYKLIQI
jgi:hypothetical protein